MVDRARTTEDRMKRKRRTGAEQFLHSAEGTARLEKRPMLDRDQLLSPTCLVDSRIIAWKPPWTMDALTPLCVHSGEVAVVDFERRRGNHMLTKSGFHGVKASLRNAVKFV
ncbi:unnamed protein product [Lasius platythorax]|uniref:Uncharacterized protein n=1 Tax=Lasius platythorax TaxID=488582 RepID=A0AAV2NSP9_9HYME